MPENMLTISIDKSSITEGRADRWHEVVNAYKNQKILTGSLGGIEQLEGGWVVAVVYCMGYRVLIPMEEMMIDLKGDGHEKADTLNRQVRIANNMLGADIDFLIRSVEEKEQSIVASRKDAMLKKRRMFYFSEAEGELPLLHPGRIVEARIIAVASKAVRLEVFGVEISVRSRDMSWDWFCDANEKYAVGDVVPVLVKEVAATKPEDVELLVDVKAPQPNTSRDNLIKCKRQGKYVGVITEIYKGTYFIRLTIGVNAVAHSSNTTVAPAKGDTVGFAATRINLEMETAEGIITRIIRQAG